MERGFVQVYTGEGKGKTTAAFGLALRAVGRGLKVTVCQFLKDGHSGEVEAAHAFYPQLQIRQIAQTERFFRCLNPEEQEALRTKAALEYAALCQDLMQSPCNLLILDEIFAALEKGLLTSEQICHLIDYKPLQTELILTGRHAPAEILARADLITEMCAVRHYYQKGVPARDGIEK